jgi:hypothetical protein
LGLFSWAHSDEFFDLERKLLKDSGTLDVLLNELERLDRQMGEIFQNQGTDAIVLPKNWTGGLDGD